MRTSERKDRMLTIRITPAEAKELKKAAAAAGETGVSRYLINLHHATKRKKV